VWWSPLLWAQPPPSSPSVNGTQLWGPTPAEQKIGCSRKLVVALTVPNGQTLGTETVEALLTKVVDGTGQGDVAGPTVRQLAEPYKVTVTKTPVYVVYPLTYIQTFNGRPYELVATTKKCDDASTASKPTCGWFKNDAGARYAAGVPASPLPIQTLEPGINTHSSSPHKLNLLLPGAARAATCGHLKAVLLVLFKAFRRLEGKRAAMAETWVCPASPVLAAAYSRARGTAASARPRTLWISPLGPARAAPASPLTAASGARDSSSGAYPPPPTACA